MVLINIIIIIIADLSQDIASEYLIINYKKYRSQVPEIRNVKKLIDDKYSLNHFICK